MKRRLILCARQLPSDGWFVAYYAFMRPHGAARIAQFCRWPLVRCLCGLVLAALLAGCDSGTNPFPSQAALKNLKSGCDESLRKATNTIPCAVEFLRFFPRAFPSWSYYTGEVGQPTLNLETLLYDRYQLTMRVPVVLKSGRRDIQSFGEPEFLLLQVSEVKQVVRVGSMGAATNLLVGKQGDRSLHFGPADWKNVVAHGGDLSVLGTTISTNNPAPGFELLRTDWRMRGKEP
jgi:hypothetical protein